MCKKVKHVFSKNPNLINSSAKDKQMWYQYNSLNTVFLNYLKDFVVTKDVLLDKKTAVKFLVRRKRDLWTTIEEECSPNENGCSWEEVEENHSTTERGVSYEECFKHMRRHKRIGIIVVFIINPLDSYLYI